MYGWTDETRDQTRTALQREADAASTLFAKARSMLEHPTTADVGLLLRAHMKGIASHVDVEFFRLRQLTDEVGRRSGILAAGESFFDRDWIVQQAALERHCPEMLELAFETRPNQGVETTELLEACPNECIDLSWPTTLAGFMRRPRRLPLRAYETTDATAYVHPLRYQVLSGAMDSTWVTASPRGLSRAVLPYATTMQTDRKVVIVQDRFSFGNFCHFFFDGATRILHYVSHFGYQDEIFVMGGIPQAYHEIVGQALSSVARIPISSLYFPDRGYLLKGARSTVWFSDQKEMHAHPAQMAHPRSLALLSKVAERIPGTPANVKRLYVSRGDANRRRIKNEGDLVRALEGRGFVPVQLAKIPVEEQIALFRGAEIVVAPHGMGLTHIAVSNRIGRVVELFHPTAGTDAYAFVSRSAGIQYGYILGEGIPATHSDFAIDPAKVLDVLGPNEMALRRPNWKRKANLIPSSRTFHGFEGGRGEPEDDWTEFDFSPMVADQAVRLHRKRGPAANTLVGAWREVDIVPETPYVLSCWVWLPPRMPADEVSIRIAKWKIEQIQRADLKLRGAWQRIWFLAISPHATTRCDVGLHVVGHEGAMLASTCWQFERGVTPSAYSATM